MKAKILLAILNICFDADSECKIEESNNGQLYLTGDFSSLSERAFRETSFNNVSILSDTEILINL